MFQATSNIAFRLSIDRSDAYFSQAEPVRTPAIEVFRDSSRDATTRARDLLSRMTLEEKAAQMVCIWREKADKLLDASGNFDEEKARKAFADGIAPGQVGRPSDSGGGKNAREMAELTNAVQRYFIENTRLRIPVIFHEECLHGLAATDATSYPQPIAMGATFDPDLVEAIYARTAEEARTRGAHQALTPVVDVARDPRWGRVEETFGEDPYLVAQLGVAAIKGFQGEGDYRDGKHVLATLKHFAAHGQPESGMNCAPVNVSERVLRETFLYPFKEAVQKAGAVSVMASYNEIDGVPSHANRRLLRDILREEWGFDGFIVSDYFAIWELHDRPDTHGHSVAADKKEAARLAVRAGVNIELPDPDCYLHLVDLVREGSIQEAELDELVEPMLRFKFELGLFEKPYIDPDAAQRIVDEGANRDLALKAAHEAITLLKNEGGVLPLRPDQRIAVVGPNAHRSLLGGYSGRPRYNSTVLDGIRERAEVIYSEGCRITLDGSWNDDAVRPSDPEEDRRMIAGAVEAVKDADVIVLAIGGNEQTSREAWARNHMGDRASLELIGRQEELVNAMLESGKPVVALLFNGRPLAVNLLKERVPAILECWYLGQETGRAVADVLFGDVNPSGKLPISIPRSAGHLPAFYNYKPSARRGYLFDDVSPLFPFGFGLSYTRFEIGNVRLERSEIAVGEAARVTAEIANTGSCTGTEVVQMYIRDRVSSVTRPVKELKGFERVSLEAGERRTLSFEVTPDRLSLYDIDMNFVVEPGEFEIMVGTSSRDEDLRKVVLRVV